MEASLEEKGRPRHTGGARVPENSGKVLVATGRMILQKKRSEKWPDGSKTAESSSKIKDRSVFSGLTTEKVCTYAGLIWGEWCRGRPHCSRDQVYV